MRADNADARLTEKGYRVGCVGKERFDVFCREKAKVSREYLCVCVYVCVYVCMYIRVYNACVCVFVNMHICIHVHVYVYESISVCSYVVWIKI